jgi:hypothetical protein
MTPYVAENKQDRPRRGIKKDGEQHQQKDFLNQVGKPETTRMTGKLTGSASACEIGTCCTSPVVPGLNCYTLTSIAYNHNLVDNQVLVKHEFFHLSVAY